MQKRLLSMLLVMAMILSVMPIGAVATEPQEEISSVETTAVQQTAEAAAQAEELQEAADAPAAQAMEATVSHDHSIDGTVPEWDAWESVTTLPTSAGYYYLTGDVNLSAAAAVTANGTADTCNIVLCMNGFNITGPTDGRVYRVVDGAKVSICNCGLRDDTHGVIVPGAGLKGGMAWLGITTSGVTTETKLTLDNVIIDGDGRTNTAAGGAVFLESVYCTLDMNNTIIRNCKISTSVPTTNNKGETISAIHNGGSAIRSHNGKVTATNCEITNNTAVNGGTYAAPAAINLSGTAKLTMTDCRLSGNISEVAGGTAIYAGSGTSVTLNDCEITRNTSTQAQSGAVYVIGAAVDLYLNGGTVITGNSNKDGEATNLVIQNKIDTSASDQEMGFIRVYGLSDGANVGFRWRPATNEPANISDAFGTDGASVENWTPAWLVNDLSGKMLTLAANGTLSYVDHAHKDDAAGVVWKPWGSTEEEKTKLPTSDYYYLVADITPTVSNTMPTDLHLCLNGHNITAGKTGERFLDMREANKAAIHDCTAHYEGEAYVAGEISGFTNAAILFQGSNTGAVVDFYDGILKNNSRAESGAICVQGSGTFNMHGGLIENNQGFAAIGGAFYLGGSKTSLNIYDGEIRNNIAGELNEDGTVKTVSNGGAIYNSNGVVIISGGKITGNSALGGTGGAIHMEKGKMTVSGGIIENNTATKGGAICNNDGEVTISGGTITGNGALDGTGGAIQIEKGTVNIGGGIIENNTADQRGGAISMAGGAANITGGIFRGNAAGPAELASGVDYAAFTGGAIYCSAGTLSVKNATFDGNHAIAHGGAICTEVGVTIDNCTFTNNRSEKLGGGAVAFRGTAEQVSTVSGTTFQENRTATSGGAVYINAATLSLDSATKILNNEAVNGGGAIYASNHATVNVSGELTGNGISLSTYGSVITAETNATVNLLDGTNIHDNKAKLTEINIIRGATLDVQGGTFVGNSTWADIRVLGGTFKQSGGTITDASESGVFTKSYGIYIADWIPSKHPDTVQAYTRGQAFITGGTITGIDANYNAVMVLNSASLTMTGGEISNMTTSAESGAAVCMGTLDEADPAYTDQHILTLSGGKITNNATRGVNVIEGQMRLLEDGEVSNNIWSMAGVDGAGIRINDDAVLYMSGGRVTGNRAVGSAASGGGLNLRGNAVITGGLISDNYANNGGGLLVREEGGHVDITGGVIENNTAVYGGGAIYVYRSGMRIDADYSAPDLPEGMAKAGVEPVVIRGNTATKGGAIYIESEALTIHINHAEIYNNTCHAQGTNQFGTPAMKQAAAIFIHGGEVTLGGGTYIHDNTGAENREEILVGVYAVVTLNDVRIDNPTPVSNEVVPNAVTMAGGAMPLKITQEFIDYMKAQMDLLENPAYALRVGLDGYGWIFEGNENLTGKAIMDSGTLVYPSQYGVKQWGDREEEPEMVHQYHAERKVFAVTADGTTQLYSFFDEAYAAYADLKATDPNAYITMLASYNGIDVNLTSDLILHLDGHRLSTILHADSEAVSVQATDTFTDDYDVEDDLGTGYIRVRTDESGDLGNVNVVYQWQATKATGASKTKRYMTAIDWAQRAADKDALALDPRSGNHNEYTFHRFYAGNNVANLNPTIRGLGYHTIFAGDQRVKEYLLNNGVTDEASGKSYAMGCYMWLEDPTTQEIVNGATVVMGDDALDFVANDTSANTYVWRLWDIMLDEDDKKDVAVAKSWDMTVDEWNTYYKDIIVCSQPFICFSNPVPYHNEKGELVPNPNEGYEVKSSTYRFNLQKALTAVNNDVVANGEASAYIVNEEFWNSTLEFTEKFHSYFETWALDAINAYWQQV